MGTGCFVGLQLLAVLVLVVEVVVVLVVLYSSL